MRVFGWLCLAGLLLPAAKAEKRAGVLYPRKLAERARANAARHDWAARIRDHLVEQAAPWRQLPDDKLWEMMFGPAITRSHMVWSAGFCPACKRPVPMYDWQIDAWRQPWKARCPHCRMLFPTNDFEAFYRSGLDQHGLFDPKRADRRLLFHAQHPAADDPLRSFGVDDGEGYVEGAHRWRFIGCYLQYGQYRQLVEAGITRLAAAFLATGDPAYARKAGILLDRVADVFPDFDFAAQGLVYERARYGGGRAGYISYAIDSAYEVRRLALAYDQVFDGICTDRELVQFLSRKAAAFKLPNPKTDFASIQRNIEDRIFGDVLKKPEKIRTNYPGTDVALLVINTVLEWPSNQAEVKAAIDRIVADSTPVDGLTGEKGLTGYATIAPRFLAELLEEYTRAGVLDLRAVLARNPGFRQTYRFFVDTWCGRKYYPYSGDCGAFALRATEYAGLSLRAGEPRGKLEAGPSPSAYSFLWRLYQATGDPMYAQLMYLGNRDSVDGLPYDLFAEDPDKVARGVKQAIARNGALPPAGSVHKAGWRLAILRSPRDPDAGAVWLDYDSVPASKIKSHYHHDAMNLGLFAKGLDLLPEFGYPAVQFGDWHTPQARWHTTTAAHNTVVVDGQNQAGGEGKLTLWEDGPVFRVMRASSPAQIRGTQYERTAAMVDLPGRDFYVLDVFRVAGGADHAKFTRSHFGRLATSGLKLAPAPDYGFGALMRGFRADLGAQPGWTADWTIEDRHGYLPAGSQVRLRYTDLTGNAEAHTAESWTVRNATSTEEFWIPTLMTRRRAQAAPLASTFVSVLEPYESAPRIRSIRRLALETADGKPAGDASVALEMRLADGQTDLWITADTLAPPGALIERTHNLKLDGEMLFLRLDAGGKPVHRVQR